MLTPVVRHLALVITQNGCLLITSVPMATGSMLAECLHALISMLGVQSTLHLISIAFLKINFSNG